MTLLERKVMLERVVASKEYDFLRADEHCGDKLMFVTFGGSYAYGTNIEGSDIDIRGVTANTVQELIGLTHFEQLIDNNTDTTIYGMGKYVSLVAACNPNVIEMLGAEPEMYTHVSKTGKMLIDNRKLFLSRRAANAFGGYATAQLRRLQVNIAKHRVSPEQKGEFMLNTCNTAMRVLEDAHGVPNGTVRLGLANHLDDEGEPIVCVYPDYNYDIFAKDGIPLTEYAAYLSELRGIVKSYGSLGPRNDRAKEKSDAQLNKHAMHLIRLYLMAFDILEKEEINTYRYADREELLAIRNGKYMAQDGTFVPEFFVMVDKYEARLKRDYAETSLPDKPDMKKVENLVIEINKESMRKELAK
jgi:predicted nucleotidyltransferase